MTEPDLETDELARAVIGAAIEVHTILGAGFLETTYEQALAIEFELRGIPFSANGQWHWNTKAAASAKRGWIS